MVTTPVGKRWQRGHTKDSILPPRLCVCGGRGVGVWVRFWVFGVGACLSCQKDNIPITTREQVGLHAVWTGISVWTNQRALWTNRWNDSGGGVGQNGVISEKIPKTQNSFPSVIDSAFLQTSTQTLSVPASQRHYCINPTTTNVAYLRNLFFFF